MKAADVEVIPPKRTRRELLPIPHDASRTDLKRVDEIKDSMEMLDPKRETFDERQARLERLRVPYAGMVAHMEMAAIVMAAGGSYRLAAAKAGVSVRQVKKYYSTADFRARIDELRKTRFSKILGRVLKDLDRRTKPGTIEKIELLDLLRVFDRVAGTPGKGGGGLNIGEVNVQNNNYSALTSALVAAVSGGEGRDFPEYGPEELSLPDEGTSE